MKLYQQPTMPTDEQIEKFQALHQQCFGENISKTDAMTRAVGLVVLMDKIYKPIAKTDLEKLENWQPTTNLKQDQ